MGVRKRSYRKKIRFRNGKVRRRLVEWFKHTALH
jgi:hypothetical protein